MNILKFIFFGGGGGREIKLQSYFIIIGFI